ncbi:hypothetical protein [Micromonospora sp. NPDC050200]|uniref:hypothetical protein n=1 Tax=Micromonospora sp. NPDC050200 TaxID=3155664 RepID=UPI00340085B1
MIIWTSHARPCYHQRGRVYTNHIKPGSLATLPRHCLFAAYHALADVLDGLGRTEEAADLRRRQLGEATGGWPGIG